MLVAGHAPRLTEGADETPMIDPDQIGITPQDQQILRLPAQGCSNKQIASYLNVSPPTAKQHLLALFVELLDGTKTGPIPRLAAAPTAQRKSIGYGLPCSKCRAYSPADLETCPICNSPDRVSPNAVPTLPVVPAIATPDAGVAKSLAASSHP